MSVLAFVCRWTNAEVVAAWVSADKDMDTMAAQDLRVRSILDRGYQRCRLAEKFDRLVFLAGKNKLQSDAGTHV